MTQQWIRKFGLSISGGGQSLDVSNLRCKFSIKMQPNHTPPFAEIIVYNLAEQTAGQVVTANSRMKNVEVTAGYEDNAAVIFKGQIQQAFKGRENPTDTYLFLNCSGEFGFNFARVNKTLAAKSTPKDILDVAVKAMGEFGAQLGTVTPDLSKPEYPRAIVLYGMARDIIREIALSKDAHWFLHNGDIHILEKTKTIEGGDVTLNSTSGLIGMPTQSFDGILARCLINPMIKPGSVVIIDQKSIQMARFELGVGGQPTPENAKMPALSSDGKYKVIKMDIVGDSRGQDWYMDLVCLSTGDTFIPDSALPYIGNT